MIFFGFAGLIAGVCIGWFTRSAYSRYLWGLERRVRRAAMGGQRKHNGR